MKKILFVLLSGILLSICGCDYIDSESTRIDEDKQTCQFTIEDRITSLIRVTSLENTERVDVYSSSDEDYLYSYDLYHYSIEILYDFNGKLCNQLLSYGAKYDKNSNELLYGEVQLDSLSEGVYVILASHTNFDLMGNIVSNSTEGEFYILLSDYVTEYDNSLDYDYQSDDIKIYIQDVVDNYSSYIPAIID